MNCYVLIGGRSSRMGRSKPELFLDRVNSAASRVFEKVIAVQRPGAQPAPIETIFEAEHDGAAAVYGLAAALEHAGAPCFVLAVDFPRLTSDTLRFLRETFEASQASIVAPLWEQIAQPFCTGYRPEVLRVVQQRLHAGTLDARGLLAVCRTELIGEEAIRARFGNRVLMSVNTPEELAEAEKPE